MWDPDPDSFGAVDPDTINPDPHHCMQQSKTVSNYKSIAFVNKISNEFVL